ncbi:hypothetical protein OQ279_07065 [Salinimicrobium sp. MT39]|uniref:Uncharacterized protein n=1 Tax=Salinimicrobium profundisediminis TaxID=2994553 RepID=A0A9X3CVY4_9FLAO|nr:hypothetical protein [Salinimicrobium profundisediminis]MCX2837912.1 hypothetical protein [Salinimicrobium profundisediminis]
MLEKRKEIIDWLNEVEVNYDCGKLKQNDLHIWPILRWSLFKDIVKREGYIKNTNQPIQSSKALKFKLYNILENVKGFIGYLKLKFGLINKVDVIFAASHTHRSYYRSKFVNRFYDPMSEYLDHEKVKFLNADYSVKNRKDYTLKENHFPLTSIYYFFKRITKRKDTWTSLANNELLQIIIAEYEHSFKVHFNKKAFFKKIIAVLNWAKVYELLLKATNAKLCFELCYYHDAMYGLNLAASRKGVRSVDVQHGPQGMLHAAYTGFNKVPNAGYTCLPDYFWVWDDMSLSNLQNRLNNTSFHNVIKGGNPWVYFLESQHYDLKHFEEKKILLFSLQPILPFLPDILLDAIESTKDGYEWWLRMHPRMTENDILEIKAVINERSLDHLVNLDDATNLPLPLVLKNASVHISKSSGCVLEASMLGTPNIIVDPLGEVYFSDIIDEKMNFKQTKGDLWPLIESLEGRKKISVKNEMISAIELLLK